MKNTLAVGLILAGAILIYAGFKNWTLPETVKFFAGQGAPEHGRQMTEQEKKDLSNLTWGNGQAPGVTVAPPGKGLPDAKNFGVLPEITGVPWPGQ